MLIQYCPKAEEFEDHLGELEIFLVFMKTVLVRVLVAVIKHHDQIQLER